MEARFSRLREEAFAAVLQRAGHGCRTSAPAKFPQVRPTWVQLDADPAWITRWVRKLPSPVGVMACNDQIGLAIIHACLKLGRHVPDEVAVLGVDNDELLGEYGHVPLSSVDTDLERIGYEAARMLDAIMHHRPLPVREVKIPPKGIVARHSTETLAIPDQDLAAAVRFIRENACAGIDVRDVLAAFPISRRTLEQKFRKFLGHTPAEEIRRVRLNRVRELLAKTDWSLFEIAAQTGFEHRTHLSMLFRKTFGSSPREYRKKNQKQTRPFSSES